MNPNNTIQKSIPTLGGWNADATEASMPDGDLLEAINFRKAKPDEYETRSGIKDMGFGPAPHDTAHFLGSKFPRATCEYRLDDKYVNVVFYEESGNLSALVINNELGTPVEVQIPNIVTGGSNYECMACQYNTYLIVTIFGYGVYALFPSAANLTTWGAPIQLGKTLTPTPQSQFNFPVISPATTEEFKFLDSVSGDLIVYDYEVPYASQTNGRVDQFTPKYPVTGHEAIKTRLPIAAPYFRVSGDSTKAQNLRSTNQVRQFEWDLGNPDGTNTGTIDGDSHLPIRTTSGSDHLLKRGWHYRVVMKAKYTDIKAQDFTFFHEPSVDFFVPDNDYAPPFLCIDVAGAFFGIDNMIHGDAINVASNIDFWSKKLRNDANSLTVLPSITASNPYTDTDFANLVAKFRDHFHDGTDYDVERQNSLTGAEADPYYFTARVLGYYQLNRSAGLFPYPYKVPVPVSELLGAPQTIFNWADFGTLPGAVYEIDVYRTAHVDSPLFEAQTYGLAGTIKLNGTFNDTIKDSDLDFNGEIQRESGYLAGEMSGKVIRVWSNNLRLGDTQTAYQIRKPADLCQAFAFDWIEGGVVASGLTTLTNLNSAAVGDGFRPFTYGYQYGDNDGNVSPLTVIHTSLAGTVDYSEPSLPAKVGIGFTFPHGYGSKVNKILIFEGRYNVGGSGVRQYHKIGEIQPKDGHFLWRGFNAEADWIAAPNIASSAPKISHDPGACVWNEAQDMFFWPQINFELEHQFAPVTKIGVAVGPAHICTDQTVVKTDFGTDNRWEEVSTGPDSVGCIGRFCSIELGKALIFLSAKGLFLAEGSGVRPFPANVQTLVLKYLQEVITGVPRLANARRASMGWLGQRNELWLSFPASSDLSDGVHAAGAMPQITIIYRFFEDFGSFSMKDVVNYRFEIDDSLNQAGSTTVDPVTQIFYIGSSIGRLYAAFYDNIYIPGTPRLRIIDCDSTSDWQRPAYLTVPLAFHSPSIIKKLTEVELTADVQCNLSIASGMRRTDGAYLPFTTNGYLHDNASVIAQTIDAAQKFLQPFAHPLSGDIYNHSDRVPLVRIITSPAGGVHKGRIKSIEVEFFTPEEKNMSQTFYNLKYYGSLTDAAQHS